MAGIRDDSAGSYGQWTNPDDWSFLDHVKAYGSDAGNALSALTSNVVNGLSPFHPNATQYGQPSLQVPPMIQGIADSYKRLAGTPSKPGSAYDLSGVPELDAPLQQDMSNVLLSLYGGNALAGVTKPAGSVGMFAGRNAKTADLAALSKAEQLAGQGATRDAIWNETGWFQGPDQKWRFEIDDSKAYLDDWGSGVEAKLGKVFDHRPAFEAYPSLSDIDITASRGQGGSFNPDANSMQVDWSPARTSTALHEAQHAIQGYEGFSPGSSPSSIANMAQLSELRNKLTPEQLSEWGGLSMDDKKMLAYRAHAGEVESRAVQARQDLTPEQRKARAPWLDYDVPESQQIVRLLSDTGKPSLLGSALATAGEQPKGITAYHGSPHDFDKFSLDKIGTGEGAQAYGHGLYFADSEAVAQSYRDALASSRNGSALNDADGLARNALLSTNGDSKKALASLDQRKSSLQAQGFLSQDGAAALDEAISKLRDGSVNHPGHMYQVRINADPESFLDWDKPLSQHSQKAREALTKLGHGVFADSSLFGSSMAPKPSELKSYAEAGIPGIRYLDGNSRADGAGSSNYVVFDDSLIEILKKYGLAGGVVGGNALSQDPQTY